MRAATRRLITTSEKAIGISLGLNGMTSLGVIRSLAKGSVPVLGIAKGGRGISAFSRYCGAVEVVKDDDALLQLLLEIGPMSSHRPVIFCENDDFVLFLGRHYEELARYYRISSSREYAMDEIVNKRTMFRLAQDAGLEVPATFFPEGHSPEALCRRAAYPCLVKPLYTSSMHKTKGEEARNRDELDTILQQPRFRTNEFILQEVVQGPPSNVIFFCGYADSMSRLLASFTGSKVRTIPKDFGMATVAVSKRVEAVEKMSRQFLTHLGFHGLVDIEFKFDDRTNTYKFIEINPRPCNLIELSAAAGIDLALIAYRDACGEKVTDGPEQADGVEWVSILDDLATCVKYHFRGDRRILLDWLKKALGSDACAVFSLRDPIPFLVKLAHPAVRRLSGGPS